MGIKAGISFGFTEPSSTAAEYVSLAEKEGFNGIAWIADSQLIWRDVYVALTLALGKTKTIRIGPGVTNPVTRDPSVTASAIASLDELSPGRTVLGLGVGDSSVHTLHRSPATLEELRSSVDIIRGLLEGREVPVDGKKIRLSWAKRRIPIYLASTGPKSLRMAGEIADGVIINVGTHPSLINWALGHIEEGARLSKRSLKDIDIWLRAHCYPDQDPEKAKSMLKGAAATKANGLARYAKDESFRKHLSKDLVQDIERLAQEYDYYGHLKRGTKHTDLVTDRILDELVIAGTPSYAASRIEDIVKKTGVNQFAFTAYGFPDIPAYLKSMAKDIVQPMQ